MLRLRPYKKCDADIIAGWIQDELTYQRWSAGAFGDYPLTAEKLHAYYAAQEDNCDFLPMTAIDESGAVGHLFMRFTDAEKTKLRFGFIIVDDSKRGMHFGSEMLRLAIRYAFEILKVRRITLGVFENNPAARHCYQSVGFRLSDNQKGQSYRILNEDWLILGMEIENP